DGEPRALPQRAQPPGAGDARVRRLAVAPARAGHGRARGRAPRAPRAVLRAARRARGRAEACGRGVAVVPRSPAARPVLKSESRRSFTEEPARSVLGCL